MNRKILSVVFSALVCSTLAHDYLRAIELSGSHERIARRAPYAGVFENRAVEEKCHYICPQPPPTDPGTPGTNLQLIHGINIFGLVNIKEEVAIGFHLELSLVIIINGKTGATVLLDIEKEVGIYFPAGSNDNLWLSSKVTFEDYLLKLSVLTVVRNWKNGQNFKLSSPSKQVTSIVVSIVKHLSYEISKRVEKNPDCAISVLVVLTKTLVKAKDVLKLILSRVDSTSLVIQGGLVKLVGILQGLQALGQKIPGVLNLLVRNLNVSLLLAYSSGFGIVLNLLAQNSKSIDFSKVLGDQLKNPQDLLGLAVTLDYGSYLGIAGIVAVIYNVQLYAQKKITLEALIDILIQVEASNVQKIEQKTWDDHIKIYLSIIQDQTSTFHNDQYWSLHNKFVQDIKNEKLVIGGINVSAIISTLINTSGSCTLSRVLRVLLELKVLVSLTTIVSTLYLRLIWFVISGEGLVFIAQLLPSISISIDLTSATSIIKQILSSVNIASILKYIITLDVVGLLTHLPVLGPIFESLNTALKVVGIAAQVSLIQALKETTSVLNSIKNWVWYGLGQAGGSKPSGGGIAGLSPIGGGVSISWSASWSSTSTWSSSSSGSSGSGGGTSGSGSGSGSNSGGVTTSSGGAGSGGWFGWGGSSNSGSSNSGSKGGSWSFGFGK
ncbi:hypothetical protein WA026_018495 [Henosepilachna vigintioctopunctata]|uniref:Uncharacterized protein n=1 Tax=Henosepilachna vigintioctopunctata TaxID=420089 RepID=A0AAW1V084_9CUCU